MSSGDENSNGNGSRPSMHPEAVQALAEATAAKQSADEAWVLRIDERVADIWAGRTPWQQGVSSEFVSVRGQLEVVTSQLTKIKNGVLLLAMPHKFKPTVWFVAIAAFSGVVVAVATLLLSK